MTPEILYGLLAATLALALGWAMLRYATRNKSKDALTERATKRVMDDPGPEPMKGDRPQQPDVLPTTTPAPRVR